MTKVELLGICRTAINRIHLAYASLVLWAYPDTPDFFDQLYGEMPEEVKLHTGVTEFVHDAVAMRIALEELYNLAYRAALNDVLAIVKSYCYSTGQLDKLKAQPWFNFWRVLRNYFSHDMKFNFNPAERALLPILWSGVTIELAMNGNTLTHGQCSRGKMLELLEAAQEFVRRDVV